MSNACHTLGRPIQANPTTAMFRQRWPTNDGQPTMDNQRWPIQQWPIQQRPIRPTPKPMTANKSKQTQRPIQRRPIQRWPTREQASGAKYYVRTPSLAIIPRISLSLWIRWQPPEVVPHEHDASTPQQCNHHRHLMHITTTPLNF